MKKLHNALPRIADFLLGSVTILGLALVNLFLVCLFVKAAIEIYRGVF